MNPRATRMADIVASVPELTILTISIDGTIATICSAMAVSTSVGAPKLVPCSLAVVIAATTTGCAWPRISGPQEQT